MKVLFLAGYFSAILLTLTASGAPGGNKPWTLVTGRYGAAAVSDGQALYVVCGSGPFDALGSIEKIDLRTGLSTVLSAKLDLRRYHAAVVIGREIFVLGGEAQDGFVATVQAVNLDTGAVRRVGHMPTPRRMLSAVAVEATIFTFGGRAFTEVDDRSERSTAVEIYDAAKNRWFGGPPLPKPKECPAVINGPYVYLLGGYNGERTAVRASQRLNLTTARWEELAATPFPLSAYSAVSLGEAIVCFGDFDEQGRVAAYLVAEGKWRVLDIPFSARRHSAACLVGDQVYVAGGVFRTAGLRIIERFSAASISAAIARAVQ